MEQNSQQDMFIQTLSQEQSDEIIDTFTCEIIQVLEDLNLSEGHSVALASILLKHSIGLYRSFLSDQEIKALLEYAGDTINKVDPHFALNRTLN